MASSSGGDTNKDDNSNSKSKSAYTTLGYLRSVREWATPTLKRTAFLEKGVLTPEEFVRAGDELVYRCPTWTWERGDLLRSKAYLPPDKQFLQTRRVPCTLRVASLEQQLDTMMEQEQQHQGGKDDEDDWLVSTMIQNVHLSSEDDVEEPNPDVVEDDFDILDSEGEVMVSASPPRMMDDVQQEQTASGAAVAAAADSDEEEYADMADFEDDNVLQDDAAAATMMSTTTTTATSSTKYRSNKNNLLKVRTYDLSITYDKYYQTPRVWMVGQTAGDGTGQPLTAEQMMQDVMSDYALKTVTMEAHPHLSGPFASIHPCKHGQVMKTIVQNLIQASSSSSSSSPSNDNNNNISNGPTVEMYLFIFLKFVSSIIPTINYDFTMQVTADTTAAAPPAK